MNDGCARIYIPVVPIDSHLGQVFVRILFSFLSFVSRANVFGEKRKNLSVRADLSAISTGFTFPIVEWIASVKRELFSPSNGGH